MRRLKTFIAAATALAVCAALAAGEKKKPADEDFHPELIHRPQDLAPPEQFIVPRPPVETRPKGSLLRKAHHQPRRIDTSELLRRKYALYAGEIVSHSLPTPGGPVSPLPPRQAAEFQPKNDRNFAAVAFWAVIAACATAALWFLLKVLRNRRRTETA